MWSVFSWSTLHTCVGCELWWWCLTLRNSGRVTLLFRVAISACVNSSLVNKSSISWTTEHFTCVTWPLSRLCVLSTSGQAGLALISDKIFGPSSWFFIHQAVLGGGGKNTGWGWKLGRWHLSNSQRLEVKKLIKDFHIAVTSWHSWPLSRWAKKSTERRMAQLSLSCKSAAVQNMTATALAGPLRGVEHFQGNDLKNDNAGSCVILIIPCAHGK